MGAHQPPPPRVRAAGARGPPRPALRHRRPRAVRCQPDGGALREDPLHRTPLPPSPAASICSVQPLPCLAQQPTAFPFCGRKTRATVSPPQFLSAFGELEHSPTPETCLYPGPRFASTTKKLWRRNCGAGQRHRYRPSLDAPRFSSCARWLNEHVWAGHGAAGGRRGGAEAVGGAVVAARASAERRAHDGARGGAGAVTCAGTYAPRCPY